MKTLEEVNKDPEFREYMSAEEDARKMENSHLDEARNEGKIEVARNMLSENMDINLIMKLTNLSEEEINKLTEWWKDYQWYMLRSAIEDKKANISY